MCFSLGWWQDLLIWVVIVVAVVALLKLLLPWLLGQMGVDAGIILQAINIVVWAFVAIVVIYVVFALISCLLGAGGSPPLFPRR
jgi:hypothetical protein